MSARAALLCAVALLAPAVAACGADSSGDGTGATRSDRLVDFAKQPPYVNALEIEPDSGDFLLTTNRGFFRIDRDSSRVRPIQGRISAGERRATVGTFLELAVEGPGRLIGSGHPDQQGALPAFWASSAQTTRAGRGRSYRVSVTPTCTRSSSSTAGCTPSTR